MSGKWDWDVPEDADWDQEDEMSIRTEDDDQEEVLSKKFEVDGTPELKEGSVMEVIESRKGEYRFLPVFGFQ